VLQSVIYNKLTCTIFIISMVIILFYFHSQHIIVMLELFYTACSLVRYCDISLENNKEITRYRYYFISSITIELLFFICIKANKIRRALNFGVRVTSHFLGINSHFVRRHVIQSVWYAFDQVFWIEWKGLTEKNIKRI